MSTAQEVQDSYNQKASEYESMCGPEWQDPENTPNTQPTVVATRKVFEMCGELLASASKTILADNKNHQQQQTPLFLFADIGCGPAFLIEWIMKERHSLLPAILQEEEHASLLLAHIVGGDLSQTMVELAQKRIEAEAAALGIQHSKVPACPRTVVLDMFHMGPVFPPDSVVCMGNYCSIQHFDAALVAKALQEALNAVMPEGVFLLQFWTAETDGPMASAPAGEVFLNYTTATIEQLAKRTESADGSKSFQLVEQSKHTYVFDPESGEGMEYAFFFLKVKKN